MLELILIKSLLIIQKYNQYRHYITIKKEDKELTNLYKTLDHLISHYQRDISFDEYSMAIKLDWGDYQDLLVQIKDSNIADDILKDSINTLISRSQAYSLALLSIDVSEGRQPFEKIVNFYDSEIKDKEDIEEIEFVTDDLQQIYEETVHKPGLRWRLPSLNKMLGPLRKGNFGFLFARPETGKTTLLASEVTFMASQLKDEDGPIIWYNNEEEGKKVKSRTYQAALGCDRAKLFSNIPRSMEYYTKITKNKILIMDNASINKREVEAICKRLKPSLVIFDQIDKLKGFDADREDLRLGAIYIWARELAKIYCPVIGVCQADVSGEGKKWLTMDNVANSKTSKQAEADWILGVGAVHDIGLEFIRYLHLSKNKLDGDIDSDPMMRHGRCECLIRPDTARYCEIGE